MPIYEFECLQCGHRYEELFQRMISSAEAVAPPCPECGAANTRRVVSSFMAAGPSGPDAGEIAAANAAERRQASVTSKEQINQWRKAKK